ncbi:MAG TPA: transglutaminaseTgpA domain-containing protein [bacterium]|jgi:transglutaminase-like putative cysteine protease
MNDRSDKPNLLVYFSHLLLFGIALNTVYLVLPNESLRWYLIGILVIAVMTGYVIRSKYYAGIGLFLDISGLAVFIYYAWKIYIDTSSFGTYLGEMLSVMLVLRSFKLFRHQDFYLPMIISLTLMVFSAIPSFSAEFVYSLLFFLMALGISMFLNNVDEFARIPRKQKRHSALKYTYDFLEDYSPLPVSRQTPAQLTRYIGPALQAGIPAVLAAFTVSSMIYFTVDHAYTPGNDQAIVSAFGSTGLESDMDDTTGLLTGGMLGADSQKYAGFSDEFNISEARIVHNSQSSEIVMEVVSNRASYWRGKGFDLYTGRGWISSEETRSTPWRFDDPTTRVSYYHGEVNHPQLEAAGIILDSDILKDTITAEFHLRKNLPGIVFHPWQPIEMKMPIPAVVIDDMFTMRAPNTADSLVANQVYSVTSRKHYAQGAYLNAYDYSLAELEESEPEFFDRYTQLPESGRTNAEDKPSYDFTRVRAKTYEVTAGKSTVYEKVDAIIRYLKSHYNYSLNPPHGVPAGEDAVDYFLFDWEYKRGHCEYFSTSMAVMCRSIGIPARVVTGYAPGNYSILTNRYIVQEKNAHAWVEVFWPDIGWVEFDPTPQTWYQGITDRAAGGWLSFHNGMEELYVFNPRGFFEKTVLPAIGSMMFSARYFFYNWDRDYYEYIEPMIPGLERIPRLGAGLIVSSLLLLMLGLRHKAKFGKDYMLTESLRKSDRSFRRIRRILLKKGYNSGSLATETDCADAARKYNPEWGDKVGEFAGQYQFIRYSGKTARRSDIQKLSKSRSAISRIPK